ncbi:MAG: hypothetical protein U0269_06080 [Polyangiales bacterium]
MTWSYWFDLTANEVANVVPTTSGVFYIARKSSLVAYPTKASATVLIGVAPGRQKGLRSVLVEIAARHREDIEQQRALGEGLRFCFQGNLGDAAAGLYSTLVDDFTNLHGAAPCCNAERSQ